MIGDSGSSMEADPLEETSPDLGSGLERGIGSNPFPGNHLKIRNLGKVSNKDF
jgi:hypothetical protein